MIWYSAAVMKRWALLFTACAAVGAAPVPSARGWDAPAAARYLDQRAATWKGHPETQRSHDTACISCHTGLPYLLARPELRRVLGEAALPLPERRRGLSALEPGFGLYFDPRFGPVPGPLFSPVLNPYFAPVAVPAFGPNFGRLPGPNFGPNFVPNFGLSAFAPCCGLSVPPSRFGSPLPARRGWRLRLNFRTGAIVFGRAFGTSTIGHPS